MDRTVIQSYLVAATPRSGRGIRRPRLGRERGAWRPSSPSSLLDACLQAVEGLLDDLLLAPRAKSSADPILEAGLGALRLESPKQPRRR